MMAVAGKHARRAAAAAELARPDLGPSAHESSNSLHRWPPPPPLCSKQAPPPEPRRRHPAVVTPTAQTTTCRQKVPQHVSATLDSGRNGSRRPRLCAGFASRRLPVTARGRRRWSQQHRSAGYA